MIESIKIENYKSIERLVLSLGRFNVFIGENGAGKSNILEAISLAGAAQARKLDNEFLASRGIRVSGPELMRSAFDPEMAFEPIRVTVRIEGGHELEYELTNDNKPYSTWQNAITSGAIGSSQKFLELFIENFKTIKDRDEKLRVAKSVTDQIKTALEIEGDSKFTNDRRVKIQLEIPHPDFITKSIDGGQLEDFMIYAPENSALRSFEREGQIEPLGINGEGLLKLLGVLSKTRNKKAIEAIKDSLQLFSWFEDFNVVRGRSHDRIEIFDHFFGDSKSSFDQRSANEGFLFLAFYFALFTSNLTPRFFAVDNVDTSLNPKLCEALIRRLAKIAKENDKQVLLTTHNPAILDGLDIGDPDHRLFIVSRGSGGQTRVRRFEMKPAASQPSRLSELFLSGMLGGLPKGF